MAPSTPHRSTASLPSAQNAFATKVLLITIGKEREMFNIHTGKLQLTAFFNIHGEPPTDEEKRERFSTAPAFPVQDDEPIKSETGLNSDYAPANTQITQTHSITTNPEDVEVVDIPDYHLVTRFHTAAAFRVFAEWLYNVPVQKPEDVHQCQVLRQAYVIAIEYKAIELQNQIMDRYRQYHVKVPVRFDDLIWMVNRTGDEVRYALTAYLIEQIAYEITEGGFVKYEEENNGFKDFLQQGVRMTRLHLVAALARHAQASGGRLGDPAKVGADWHATACSYAAPRPRLF